MTRKLTEEDRTLWDKLRESVKPLRRPRAVKRAAAAAPAPAAPAAPPPPAKRAKVAKTVTSQPPPKPSPKGPPPLAPLEDRTRKKLLRGQAAVDASIDLHGMRQERAFAALETFLRGAQAEGHRIVLVVTGKGGSQAAMGEGRGVLRQAVPGWLARPDLRPLVVGFEEAGRPHGGGGALYVRIRRRRAGPRD